MTKIRKFQNKDAKQVADLIRRNDLEVTSLYYPKEVIELWVDELTPEYIIKKSKNRQCYVATDNKKIIGYVSFDGSEIKKLFVNPDYHKKGIGRMLINKIEDFAKAKKIKKLKLDSNLYAEKFYKHVGFKKIKNKYRKVGDKKIKMIYMEKKL